MKTKRMIEILNEIYEIGLEPEKHIRSEDGDVNREDHFRIMNLFLKLSKELRNDYYDR